MVVTWGSTKASNLQCDGGSAAQALGYLIEHLLCTCPQTWDNKRRMWWGARSGLYETNWPGQDTVPLAGSGCYHLPLPVAVVLSPSQGSQYFLRWVWIIRLKVLSSPPGCDVLKGGDHVLSYLKSELIREFPLKPHCYLFFLFLFIVTGDFTVRVSFLKASWVIFPCKA